VEGQKCYDLALDTNEVGPSPRFGYPGCPGKLALGSGHAKKEACFAGSKLVRSLNLTNSLLCFSLRTVVELLKAGGQFALLAMKRSLNFGSIFREKGVDQTPPPSGQTDQAALAQRLLGRPIKLAKGDLEPVSKDSPPVDWDMVGGLVTIQGEAIDGMLDGRARVKASHLKSLVPSPVAADTPDQSEYFVSLPALIPQIQDLLGTGDPEVGPEAEYETPFTVLARQDGIRFSRQNNPQKKEAPREQPTGDLVQPLPKSVAASEEDLNAQEPEHREKREKKRSSEPENAEPPNLTLKPSRSAPAGPADHAEPPTNPLDAEDKKTQDEMRHDEPEQREPKNVAASQIKLFEMRTEEDPFAGEPAVAPLASQHWDGDSSRAGRGTGWLQEIFMTSEPLDGRRVASLFRQFPGITGALILLEGGAVLGGQLPESLNMEAALQAPEALAGFLRFIFALENRFVSPRFVTVTSSNTISLVSVGQVVLLVSHQGRKLPPGLARRLTETAEALDLIYGKY
jgi:hypothetical protein